MLKGLLAIQDRYPTLASNVRGRGLMAAVDLPSSQQRDQVIKNAYESGLMMLGCGTRSTRFRPALDIDAETLGEGLELLGGAFAALVS